MSLTHYWHHEAIIGHSHKNDFHCQKETKYREKLYYEKMLQWLAKTTIIL